MIIWLEWRRDDLSSCVKLFGPIVPHVLLKRKAGDLLFGNCYKNECGLDVEMDLSFIQSVLM